MGWFAVSPVVCLLGGIQAAGIAASFSTRITQGTRFQSAAQAACLAALAVVGATCGYTIQVGPGAAAMSAVTLMLMTMIAVVDVRQRG